MKSTTSRMQYLALQTYAKSTHIKLGRAFGCAGKALGSNLYHTKPTHIKLDRVLGCTDEALGCGRSEDADQAGMRAEREASRAGIMAERE